MTTATPPAGDTPTFAELGLEAPLAEALADQGILRPFPIQEMTLGLALQGADIIGQARTGTGKTLGFGLPMLQRLDLDEGHVQVLVIVPTRELCVQVAEDLEKAGKVKGVKVLAVYGGKSLDPQIDALRGGGVHVVVGTPGRLLDLMRRGDLNLSKVKGLVLDEADEMLDLGFLPDVEQLIEATSTPRQTLLFSATMPSAVVAMARRYMEKPTFLRADVEEVHIAPKTQQHFFSCHRMDKPAVLARILQTPERGLTVVFCRTKRMCDILAEELRDRGIDAAPIHSDLRQESREKALNRFREGKTDVLVATEVAARGLDIDDVTHVVNYDCPDDEKMYLHRIGRTGRAGAAGVAVTLAVWNELARLNMIKKALDIEVETHEVFSTSPILDELFDLPAREERPKVEARSGDDRKGKGGSRSKSAKGAEAKDGGRSGGRGKRRSDEDRGGDDTTPAPRRGARQDAEDEGEEQRRIRRRRRGGRGKGEREAAKTGAAGLPEDAKTDGAPAAAVGDDADEGTTRSRTRTRTRSTADRPSGGRSGADGAGSQAAGRRDDGGRGSDSGDGDDAGDGATRTRTRTRTRRDSEPRSDAPAKRGAAARSDDERGGRRSDGGRGEGKRSGDERASGKRSGDDRDADRSGSRSSGGGRGGRNRGGRGRSGGRSGSGSGSSSGRSPRQEPQVSSEEARGDGQPRLRRPLEVAHLP